MPYLVAVTPVLIGKEKAVHSIENLLVVELLAQVGVHNVGGNEHIIVICAVCKILLKNAKYYLI